MVAPAGSATQQPAPQASVPFLAGSWDYSEVLATDSLTMGAQTDFSHNITPGGFLRGLSFVVTSASGVLGTSATLQGDAPYSIIYSMTLESIDGTPILYPMNGWAYFLVQRWARPWDGDPTGDPGYSASINPSFRIRFFTEGRMTIGVLPNTDARAQYRVRYTVAPLVSSDGVTGLVSASTGVTAPVITIVIAFEAYAQPPAADYGGNPIVQIPDGLALQRFCSHQAGDILNTGTATIKENRVGNLIRTLILVCRTSLGVRTDLISDPIRWRIDNTQLLIENRSRRDYEMNRFGKQQHASLQTAAPGASTGTYSPATATTTTQARPVGCYVYFRYHNPGSMDGNYWLETTEASYLQYELNGGQASGTLESITEDLAPAGPVPAYLQGI
jgi:hypothetical protein